jgi:cytochrome P450
MMSGTDGSSFSTVDHSHHRLRRSALNPFFSKKAVVALEPMIQEKVDKLCHRFSSASKTGEIIRADAAFVALTMDVISKYCFARDDDYLSEPDFKVAWKETLRGAFESVALRRQFPWMLSLMKMLPQSLVLKINPSFKLIFDWRASIEARIKPILERTEPAPESQNAFHRSVFHELRDSSLPPQEKTLDRLSDEGQIFIGAGTETTATALSKVTFYLLTNKQVLDTLRAELRTVMPNPTSPVSVTQLEQLLYLSAVIAEALRLSISVSTRLPRIATEETLTYKDWTIPSGTPVSESQYFVLMNKDIFPSPTTFDPGRWLNADGTYNHALEKYLVSFGRGTRQCLGMNLANAELFLTTARLFRRFEMELYETTVSDIDMAHDFFSPVPRLDSKGVRVRVLGEVKE